MHISSTHYQNKKIFTQKITIAYFDNKAYSKGVSLFLLTKTIVVHCFPIPNFWANDYPIQLR